MTVTTSVTTDLPADVTTNAATNGETGAGFTVVAIAPADLDRIRIQGHDDFGNPLDVFVAQHTSGTQLRCCLRYAVPGERAMLIAYRPSERGGPYSEVGPVFVHADRCAGYSDSTEYPVSFRDQRRLFRAYGPDGRQVDNQIVEPAEVDAAIEALLGRPEIEFIHSRNVLAGCYMFTITRAGAQGE
jgi:hypothetical protein